MGAQGGSMRLRIGTALVLLSMIALSTRAQEPSSASSERDATREKLRAVLETAGERSDVDVKFRQSTKEPYNFVGSMTGLKNVESLEVVVRVTASDTIGFRIFPHYKGGYINLDKVKDGPGFMRKLLHFNDLNFLFWGADNTNDVFSGYTFTLESGFPEEAVTVVLRSIRSTDRFVGELRPFIDGSASATPASK
jgi:hypothetical protein